jgi:hypothetical protein
MLLTEPWAHDQVESAAEDEPQFEFQVLEDINVFQDLLHFFFERRTLLSNRGARVWTDYYEPRNSSISPALEKVYKSSLEISTRLLSLARDLRASGDQTVINRLVKYSMSLRSKAANIRKKAAEVTLGHYMGNRLIDVSNISSFNILLNEKIYRI